MLKRSKTRGKMFDGDKFVIFLDFPEVGSRVHDCGQGGSRAFGGVFFQLFSIFSKVHETVGNVSASCFAMVSMCFNTLSAHATPPTGVAPVLWSGASFGLRGLICLVLFCETRYCGAGEK